MNRGGIFTGPTALGIAEQGVFKNAAMGAVETVNVPYWCWDTPGFKEADASCWASANKSVETFKEIGYAGDCLGAATAEECHAMALNTCRKAAINLRCPWSKPPAGNECTTMNVQLALKAGGADIVADGKWGPKTQAAFTASGKTCTQLVPACKTCPGGTSGGGGGATVIPPTSKLPPATLPPATPPPGPVTTSEGFWGLPTIAWVGIVGVAGVLAIAVALKTKKPAMAVPAKANRRRRRRARYNARCNCGY